MSKFLDDIKKEYRLAYIHNIKHFYGNSFYVESYANGQKILMGKARGKKNFKRVAILKRK